MSTPSLEKPRHARRRRRAGTGTGAAENIIIILVVAIVGLVAVRQLGSGLGGRFTETANCVGEMRTTNGECRPETTGDLPDLPDPPDTRFAAAAPASGAGPKPASGPAPEPTVCETDFGTNCQKVSCPGGVLPEPGTFDSPCCGPDFAIVSLSESAGGERTAECCPTTKTCGPLPPLPLVSQECQPNNIACSAPGPLRSCGPQSILVRFQNFAGPDTLLCCRGGSACQPIGRTPR